MNEKLRNIELERAKLAQECIDKVELMEHEIKGVKGKFTSYVRRLLAAIPVDGIVRVLTFMASKAKADGIRCVTKWINNEEGLEKLDSEPAAYAIIYYYVMRCLHERLEIDINIREDPLNPLRYLASDYNLARRASKEALAFLVWVKRFAEALFEVSR